MPLSKKHRLEDGSGSDNSEISMDAKNEILDAIAGIENRMSSIESNLNSRIDGLQNNIESIVATKLVAFEECINNRVDNMEQRLLRIENSGASGDVDIRIDNLERNARMNEPVIRGVRYVEKENLYDILLAIFKASKFNGGVDCIQTLFRLPIRNQRSRTAKRRSSPSWLNG